MIGGIVIQILVLDFGPRQQKLALRRKRQIMRHVQILKHLLRDTAENWRRNLSALMETYRRVENHGDHYLWVIQRGETGERGVVRVDRREVRFDLKDKGGFDEEAVKKALQGEGFPEVTVKSAPER